MSDRLQQIFEHKLQSSAEFRQVQRNHGLILTPENLRADWRTREGALELHKGIHWYNLELQEFMGASQDEQPEELADVLHFLVEFAILAGYSHDIVPAGPKSEELTPLDRLDVLLEASIGDPFVFPDAHTNARFAIIAGLHVAELIKNKPWCQTMRSLDEREFSRRIAGMFFWYGAVVRTAKISAQQLFDEFVRKEKINYERIQRGR